MSDERWLAATWPFVRDHLPASPARVVELGCGPLGGFVPRMGAIGYRATGVDPEAPAGPAYDRSEFEVALIEPGVDALVACASLHHVADLDVVFNRIRSLLSPSGTVVVAEWALERFDERTARWCFDRLPSGDEEHIWLHAHRENWKQSGQTWDAYLQTWIREEGLHTGAAITAGLQARFRTVATSDVPHFFADLDGVTEADEQKAIDAGLIRGNGIRFVGVKG